MYDGMGTTQHSNHPGYIFELLTGTDLSSFIELEKTNGYKDQLWFMNLAHRKKERNIYSNWFPAQ